MAAPIVVTALAYLHVISAMGWLGGDILIVSVIGPGLRSMSPAAGMEFLVKVGPPARKFYLVASTATIVFGLGLLFLLPGIPAPGIYIGAALGLVAYLDLLVVANRASVKTPRLAKEILASGQAGTASLEFVKALRRQQLGVASVLVLLIVTLMFMIAVGFPF